VWISLSDFPKTSLIVEISTTFPRQASCWMAACAVSGNCLSFPTMRSGTLFGVALGPDACHVPGPDSRVLQRS
jgi:hypothetical protein